MYAQNKSQTKTQTKKPYCKVCHDAGKSEEVYTSHYVRSDPGPNGKVICPTLLASTCKYCSKQGHTASRCTEIAKNNKIAAKLEAKNNYYNRENNNKEEVKKSTKKNNLFDLLNEDEVVKKVKKEKKEEFPALTSKKSPALTSKKTINQLVVPLQVSYANIANKGYQEAVKEEILQEIMEKKMPIVKPVIIVKKIVEQKKRSWAEMASDDEDEEEEVDLPSYNEYMEEYLGNDAW
jgi:hypothetical protein